MRLILISRGSSYHLPGWMPSWMPRWRLALQADGERHGPVGTADSRAGGGRSRCRRGAARASSAESLVLARNGGFGHGASAGPARSGEPSRCTPHGGRGTSPRGRRWMPFGPDYREIVGGQLLTVRTGTGRARVVPPRPGCARPAWDGRGRRRRAHVLHVFVEDRPPRQGNAAMRRHADAKARCRGETAVTPGSATADRGFGTNQAMEPGRSGI